MNVEVLIDGWQAGPHSYQKGQVVDRKTLVGVFGAARLPGFERLGFFAPVEENLDGKTKTELLDLARQRGVEVPSKITKPKLIELLED